MLSANTALLTTVRRATAHEHEVVAVAVDTELATQLLDKQVGAVLIDSAAVHAPIDEFVARIKAQFPDLVLVVAGGPEDQAALSKLITSNVVYRFLHRPVSPERARLFLEAALRRHDVEHAELADAPAPAAPRGAGTRGPTPNNKLYIGAGAALLLLVAVGGWLASRSPEAPAPQATAPPAVDAAAVQANRIAGLLSAGDAAYVKGEYLTPAQSGAADRYRAVLALEPNNPKARAGIERVVDKLLSAAEAALLAENPDEAEVQINQAIALAPGSSRAAFLAVQVTKERERVALNQTQTDTRSNANEQAAGFLRLASQRLASGSLIEPAQDNARFYIEAARRASPNEPGLTRATRDLQSAMLDRATAAASRGDLADAERWLANAEEARAARTAVAEVRRILQQAQITDKAATITQLTQSFRQAIGANRLLEPADDSARGYYRALLEADSAHPATVQARQSLGAEMLKEARIALGRNDLAGTDRWLAESRSIGYSSPDIAAVTRDLAAARARLTGATATPPAAGGSTATTTPPAGASQPAAAAAVVAANTLENVRFVQPRYPAAARSRGRDGWVEIEFTVGTDGAVKDPQVLAAEPNGVFEDSALDAVRRWRYKPVMQNGTVIEQRARLRIRFNLSDE
ncbi:MAG TPA: energy transducer TonB [Steroidobacteraceae bacterium]|nr:energy transducer TonB [Steroidobacteraceae bacterium]HRX89111.1 energy transducer TonB [Steroidobacteraceae bacterium]